MAAIGLCRVAEAVGADDGAVLDRTRWPSDDALANRDDGVQDAIVADDRAGPDDHVRIDGGACAD